MEEKYLRYLLKNFLYRLDLAKFDNTGHQLAVLEATINKELEKITK